MNEWSDEQIALLRRLWKEGLSTLTIGTMMGLSKNAVVGKAHRIGLFGRPSPIKPRAGSVAVRVKRVGPNAKTLPVLLSVVPPPRRCNRRNGPGSSRRAGAGCYLGASSRRYRGSGHCLAIAACLFVANVGRCGAANACLLRRAVNPSGKAIRAGLLCQARYAVARQAASGQARDG